MQHSPIPVAMQGWSVSAYLLAALNVLFGTGTLGALAVWIKTRPKMRELNLTAEENLRDDLMARVLKLESRLEQKDIIHDAERAFDRHRINNLATSLNGFLMMVKANPDDAAKAAVMIEELRVRQIEEENKEGIALRALIARIATDKAHEA